MQQPDPVDQDPDPAVPDTGVDDAELDAELDAEEEAAKLGDFA